MWLGECGWGGGGRVVGWKENALDGCEEIVLKNHFLTFLINSTLSLTYNSPPVFLLNAVQLKKTSRISWNILREFNASTCTYQSVFLVASEPFFFHQNLCLLFIQYTLINYTKIWKQAKIVFHNLVIEPEQF